ncbi:hypothetical protein BJV74DRAFT_954309 [Russula compacta]|nr:hypothetical protein BJV74DRAFT_954309 [Russula compacta]
MTFSDGSVTGERSTGGKESFEVRSRDQVTVNILPDDALLEIFHFYGPMGLVFYDFQWWWWKTLVDLHDEGQDNIIPALEHHDHLDLSSSSQIASPVLDEELLGGSAPRLRRFILENIVFPAFPKLALSAAHLSTLFLSDLPITGYISPEAIATCLATLPDLESLSIGFRSPRSRPDRIGLPPPTRAVLLVLINFTFKGFIARAERIRRQLQLSLAKVTFSSFDIILGPFRDAVELGILCREPGWQASSMAQVCSQLSPLLSHVQHLEIHEYAPGQARQGNGIDPTLWLEPFDSFPAVQHLHIYGKLRPLVAQALQELTGEWARGVAYSA